MKLYELLIETKTDILKQFEELGNTASFHFAGDNSELRSAYDAQTAAMKLYFDNPDLQDQMKKIANGFLWSLELELKSKKYAK
jgi:hypothetical protein